jgi:hypothetical protein
MVFDALAVAGAMTATDTTVASAANRRDEWDFLTGQSY